MREEEQDVPGLTGILGESSPVLRIMQYTYGGATMSGIESYLIDAYHGLNHDEVQFDFVFRYESPLQHRSAEFEAAGATIHSLGVDEQANPVARQFKEFRRFASFVRKRRPRVVEVNMTSGFMCLQAGLLARLAGARVVIMHAHDSVKNEHPLKRVLKSFTKLPLRMVATELWACSADAAAYLYGKSVVKRGEWQLIKNSVDVDKFAFAESARNETRELLGLSTDDVAVGMVGRLNDQKNHDRALDIFAKTLDANPRARLLIVGDGPLRTTLEAKVDFLGLNDAAQFLGARSDIPDLMAAFDVLLAPSHHEGFPIVALEAQASGLPVVASDAFPTETNIAGGVTILSLRDTDSEWATAMAEATMVRESRVTAAESVRLAGHDRDDTAERLNARYAGIASTLRPERN